MTKEKIVRIGGASGFWGDSMVFFTLIFLSPVFEVRLRASCS